MTFTIRSALAYDLALLLFRPLKRESDNQTESPSNSILYVKT